MTATAVPPASPAGPLAELRALHRAGGMVEHWARVPDLVAELDESDRMVAARLLAHVDVAALRSRHPEVPAVTAVVTGYGTLAGLGTALRAELVRHGYVPDVRVGDFGTAVPELDDPASAVYDARPDLTVLVLDHTAVTDELPVPFTVDDVERVLAEKLALWRRLVDRFREHGTGTLVLNTVPLPREWAVRIVDQPGRARLGALWRRANAELLDLGAVPGPVAVLDLDPLLTDGVALNDPRFAVYVHAHLSDALLARYARDLAHLVRSRTGRVRKVLALDLDGTLWGGVLGDDGVEGIEVAHTPRGEAFAAVQRLAVQLQSQGVLLAAVSKNDPDTVAAALGGHPDLAVRAEAFVRVLAGWGPKPDALRALAAELNLGVDALVFADDSPFEIAAVTARLPRVASVHLAGDPALHVPTLLADDWFTTAETTQEDRDRTRLYHEEAARAEFLTSADVASELLAGLRVQVALAPATEAELARVAQLTLRTNQFNLTTRRRSRDEVAAWAGDPRARVLAVAAGDRFGGNGIVGAAFLRVDPADPAVLHLDNLLLSCRVFSRGIEQAVLAAILGAARAAGYGAVTGEYAPTAKNAKVADLLPHYGFAADGPGRFRHALDTPVEVPGHLHLRVERAIVPVRA